MDLRTYAAQAKEAVTKFLNTKKDVYGNFSVDIITRLEGYATSGKALRGGLALAHYYQYGGKNTEEAIAAAVAVELFHSGILIIDDIIDRDELRRGLPTIHHQLKDIDANHEPDLRRGESFAMCVGLISTYLAQELFAKMNNPEVIQTMSKLYVITGFAEMQELLNDTDPKTNKEEIIKIYKEKTGKYTISMPSMVGAMLAGAPKADVSLLEKIGTDMGVLFQLKDDLLELEGSTEDIGKSNKTDVLMNNMTFPRLVLHQKVTSEERSKLDSIYGTEPTDEQMEYIKSLHTKYDTTKEINILEEEYTTKVRKQLLELSQPSEALEFLLVYNKQRTK